MQKPGFLTSETHGKYLHLLHLASDHPLIFQFALVLMPGQDGKCWKEKNPSSCSVYTEKISQVSVNRTEA